MGDLIADLHVGGLVLFERNVGRPDELARLTADAQAAATRAGNLPLIISIDQEGGRVVRMRERRGYTEVPSHMALAATGDPEMARPRLPVCLARAGWPLASIWTSLPTWTSTATRAIR